METSKIKEKINFLFSRKFFAKISNGFFGQFGRILIFIGIFGASAYCVYLWYDVIYSPQWSDEQIQNYKAGKNDKTNFNQRGFEYDMKIIETRKFKSQETLNDLTDIFRLKENSNK